MLSRLKHVVFRPLTRARDWKSEADKALTVEEFVLNNYEMLPPLTADLARFEHAGDMSASEREHYNQRPQNWTHIVAFREACTEYGLELRSAGDREYYIVRGTQPIGRLKGTTVSLNSKEARRICRSKSTTFRYLKSAGVPVPERHVFEREHYEQGLKYARHGKFDVVVKPTRGQGGSGITTTISNEADFKRAWQYAIESSCNMKSRIVVESKCEGIDVRAVVVEGRFVCAATRIPANVTGDGVSAISELIARKNAFRRSHPHYRERPIQIDEPMRLRLATRNLTLASIPPAREVLLLSDVANVSRGGDACDTTDLVSDNVRRIAERATCAIPGLAVAGVDLIVTSFKDSARVVVIEVNTSSNFGVNFSPLRGKSRNPAEAVVCAMASREGATLSPRNRRGACRTR